MHELFVIVILHSDIQVESRLVYQLEDFLMNSDVNPVIEPGQ